MPGTLLNGCGSKNSKNTSMHFITSFFLRLWNCFPRAYLPSVHLTHQLHRQYAKKCTTLIQIVLLNIGQWRWRTRPPVDHFDRVPPLRTAQRAQGGMVVIAGSLLSTHIDLTFSLYVLLDSREHEKLPVSPKLVEIVRYLFVLSKISARVF